MRLNSLVLVLTAVALVGCAKNEEPSVVGSGGAGTDGFSSPSDLADRAGVILYPGAAVPNKKSKLSSEGKETHYEIVMTTDDAPAKVLDFYAAKMDRAQKMGTKVMGFGSNGSSVIVSTVPAGKGTEIHAAAVVEKP